MIKAIFFDIDGTLLSHKTRRVPESAVRALPALRKKGIRLFIASGRHKEELKTLPLPEFDFDGYVTLNGQYCYTGERLIHAEAIAEANVRALAAAAEAESFPLVFVEDKHIYINYVNERVQRAQASISTEVPPLGTYVPGTPVYQLIPYVTGAELKRLMPLIPSCAATSWFSEAFDILPKNGGKRAGILRMLDAFSIAPAEIMAFGDGENDIDMLQLAGIGVAMGNAEDCVKKAADYVTADIDEDGIAAALRHFSVL